MNRPYGIHKLVGELDEAIHIFGGVKQEILKVIKKYPEYPNWCVKSILFDLLDMKELIGFDGDMIEAISSVPGFNKDELRDTFYDYILNKSMEQIENGGSTLFFDISKMSDTSASILVPSLVKARQREIEGIILERPSPKFYSLEKLWTTSYGFVSLFHGPFDVRVYNDGLQLLKDCLEPFGIRYSLGPGRWAPPRITGDLMELVGRITRVSAGLPEVGPPFGRTIWISVMKHMMQHPGRRVSRDELYRHLKGIGVDELPAKRTIDSLVEGGYLEYGDIIGDGAVYSDESKTFFPYLPILDWDLLSQK